MRSAARGARAAWVGLALAAAACSSPSGAEYPIYKPGDSGSPMGSPDVSLGMPSGNVAIDIHAPKAATVLSTNGPADVAAKVTITGGTDLVDPSTVRASISAGDTSASPLATSPLVGPMGDNEYAGKLPLVGLKSGDYTITVTAKSTAGQPGSATVKVKIDGGPQITVLSPVPGKHYKGSLVVIVAADAGPSPPLSNLTASIAGMPITLQPTTTAGQFRAVFDLSMPTPLRDEQLFEVSAENASKTRTDIKFAFVVDTTGPDITDTTPPPGAIVGNVVRLAARVADGAGINESTIQVLIGDKTTPQFRLPLKLDATGAYSALFDTKNLTRCKFSSDVCIVRPTISFRASDDLGNEQTISYEIAVDNMPPVADLVPPMIRSIKIDEGPRCSVAFDPLDYGIYSGDAPDDLCQVPQLFDLRARIQDSGNHGVGLKQEPISTVDPDRTAVYVLDTVVLAGVPQPLVVDTDGDEYCDAVNPKLEPTTAPLTGPRQVLKIRLAPVPPGGAADFWVNDYLNETAPMAPGCAMGRDLNPPVPLCDLGPQPTMAISYAESDLPAIWSIEPIAPAAPAYCFGGQFDTLANNVQPGNGVAGAGWKCIAVVTADKLGNASTSAPIRVYLDDYKYGGASPYQFCKPVPANAGPPPTCTGTFNRATGEVTSKACKTLDFKPKAPPHLPIETCYLGNCGVWDASH